MSSSGFKGSGTRKTSSTSTKKGFSEQDIQKFLLAGDTQSAKKTGVDDIQQQTRFDRLDFTQETPSFFGRFAGKSTKTDLKVTSSGFLGKFSDLGHGDVDLLVQNFKNRQNLILGEKRSPGRQQLLFSDR